MMRTLRRGCAQGDSVPLRTPINRPRRTFATAAPLLVALSLAPSAFAQQSGGILKVGWFDSPASMSILEESTIAAERPMMGVFNNLVMYKQDVRQNSPSSIVPDLATGWTWNQEGTELTLPLRHDVKWHDGKPFTAADVRCTFELLQGTASEKLRIRANPGTRTSLRSRRRATTRSPFI